MKNKQTEANKRWQEQNRDRTRYLRNRSTARSFLKTMNYEDLKEMKELVEKREKELEWYMKPR